ncbi:MAG: hypothetical protein ACOYY3_17640 [Chloroflexota bacterium]
MPLDAFDLVFVICAALFNLLIAAIVIARKNGQEGWARRLGAAWLGLGIPLAVVFVRFLTDGGKESGIVCSFTFVLLYMLVVFLLDHVYRFDYWSKTITHVPYLLLEYVALFGVAVISFDIHPVWGRVVSACFWVLAGSLVYAHWEKLFPRRQENRWDR